MLPPTRHHTCSSEKLHRYLPCHGAKATHSKTQSPSFSWTMEAGCASTSKSTIWETRITEMNSSTSLDVGSPMSLSSVEVIPEMTALALRCVTEPSPLPTSNSCHNRQQLGDATIHGLNGQGQALVIEHCPHIDTERRIFRTDYGHNEVSAQFGTGSLRRSNLGIVV